MRHAFLLLLALIVVVVAPFLLFGTAVEQWSTSALGSTTSTSVLAVSIAALLAADIFLPIPSSVVATAAGATLGAVAGTVVVALGLSAGCVLGASVARRLGTRVVGALIGASELEHLRASLQRHGPALLVLCRPVPVLAEASVLAAGAIGISLPSLAWWTTLANVGVAITYATLGAQAATASSFLLVFAASMVLPALAWLVSTAVRRTSATHAGEGRDGGLV